MARAGRELSAFIQDLNKFGSKGLKVLVQEWIDNNKGEILKVLKLRLLQKGVSGDGTKLEGYSEQALKTRKGKGLITSHTTLRFSGDWYKSMYVEQTYTSKNHVLIVKTRNEELKKTVYLKNKYGASILTLTKDEQSDLMFKLSKFIEAEMLKRFDVNIIIPFA
jgi:hypothetical protein